MKKTLLIISAIALCGCQNKNFTDFVNPNIGSTHSRWFFYTPASEPFGMAKVGPSTNGSYSNIQGWEAVGYEDNHTSIEGFACLHEFQIGAFMLMPTIGEIRTKPGRMDESDGWRSAFDKSSEYATAGYYSVLLKDYGIKAEATATTRVAYQRYTFPASDKANIIFDVGNRLGESGPVKDAYVRIIDNHTIEGWVITEPTYVTKYQQGAVLPMYFYAVMSKDASSVGTFLRGEEVRAESEISGIGAGAVLTYSTEADEIIEVKIGVSYTSIENARLNLETEGADKNFDNVRRQTKRMWNDYLGRIDVEGSQESMTKFYTGLYHALLGRGTASDVNGAYPRSDGGIGQIPLNEEGKPQFRHFNTDAMWGGYWNLTLLWALAYPEYYNDFVNSQLLIYDETGWLGDGIAASKYVSGVGTNMIPIVFAGAYNSGIRDYDIEKAYAAALKDVVGWEGRIEGAGKMDTKAFVELGYSPFDMTIPWHAHPGGGMFSASHTLEYSFAAYAVAQWAKELGKTEDYEKLMWLSKGWERLFDETLGLIRPKLADGSWIENFDPNESWIGFQEGNSLQYTYFVPQDPVGLVEKIGKQHFNEHLDSVMFISQQNIFAGGTEVWAFSGIEMAYNHGNQPNLHISWLFNFSGRPDLTQKWTRSICDEFYGTDGEHGYGYGQDEDQGQLGAWYVMSALGLFDVQGGTSVPPTYQIGSPQFSRATIHLRDGKRFTIRTSGTPPYIQSATLNGNRLDNCWLFRDDIYKGGELELVLGAESTDWGAETPPFYSK